MGKVLLDRRRIIAAIQRAGKKLGRAPSWAELRRLTGVPESRVRVYFKSLAEAVRAAGLKPRRVGLPVTREELLEDFARVMEKLGRRPSRNEYVKRGNFSAGAFYKKFRSWSEISAQLPGMPGLPKLTNGRPRSLKGRGTQEAEKSGDRVIARNRVIREQQTSPQICADERGLKKRLTTEATEEHGGGLPEARREILTPRLPAELEGKKRVTAAVCAMIVKTLLGPEAENWREELQPYLAQSEDPTADESGLTRIGEGLPLVNLEACSGRVIDKKRAVMGAPFVPLAMTHAPVNELGTMVLFGMLAGLLGFEINAVWGKYPDCNVTQQVEPGKRQAQRVEVEFESRNFARHKHPARMCDVLICWIHNWKDCPKHIQVIELKSVVERLLGRKI